MSYKTTIQCFILAAILLASFASPGFVQASSSCGVTYVVQPGDWLSTIANRCGVTLAQLYAANPGVGYYIYPGQVLVIPGGYSGSPGDSYNGTYTVQYGDSFSVIASRYGVSVSALWAANPHVWNINRIYPGQVLYVPGSSSSTSWFNVAPASTEPLNERSYGSAPEGTPTGKVRLINNANADAYVSLQGTTKDGVKVINEYPVDGSINVYVPIGWYTYVAWVGGTKFAGNFTLRQDSNPYIKLYINRVVVE
jgi:LysM repeat protein